VRGYFAVIVSEPNKDAQDSPISGGFISNNMLHVILCRLYNNTSRERGGSAAAFTTLPLARCLLLVASGVGVWEWGRVRVEG
jgi:hypothetical protein